MATFDLNGTTLTLGIDDGEYADIKDQRVNEFSVGDKVRLNGPGVVDDQSAVYTIGAFFLSHKTGEVLAAFTERSTISGTADMSASLDWLRPA